MVLSPLELYVGFTFTVTFNLLTCGSENFAGDFWWGNFASRSAWCRHSESIRKSVWVIKSVWVEEGWIRSNECDGVCGWRELFNNGWTKVWYVCFFVCPVARIQLNCHHIVFLPRAISLKHSNNITSNVFPSIFYSPQNFTNFSFLRVTGRGNCLPEERCVIT